MAEETPAPNQPASDASAAPPVNDALSASATQGQVAGAPQPAETASGGEAGVRGPGVIPQDAGNNAKPVDLPAFSGGTGTGAPASIDLLSDVSLQVKIELGRTRMLVEDVLRLSDGAVVELDKLAGDPVDIYVNERHVARGEVLVLNDNFCVRINEILETPIDAKQPAKQAG